MSEVFFNSIVTTLSTSVGKFLLILLPITLPIMLVYVFWVIRFRWLTMKFVASQKTCLLEIKLPKEIFKSPAGMEIFFSQLTPGGAGGWTEAFLDGKTRPFFSFEIVSIGGNVRFFVYCSQAKFKNLVESQLYAQYPNIEIFEVKEEDDYTKMINFDTVKYNMYGLQYRLTQPDPYPIKTYIDYGLDKDQKDEYKVDPITSLLEFLGSMKQGENVWFQILIQRHEKEGKFHGTLDEAKDLKAEIKKAIEEIRKETLPPDSDDGTTIKFPNPTKGQSERIAALERSASKTAFDCMIRTLYIYETTEGIFNPGNIGALIGCVKQYNSNTLNGFKPGVMTDASDTYKDFARLVPFVKGFMNRRIARVKKGLFHAYKLRSFFQYPYKNYENKPFVLTTEELATIFHFPSGMVSQTPTLKRVESRKSEAPSNLPI